MGNLFSTFEPIAFLGISWNWIAVMGLLLLPIKFWLSPNQISHTVQQNMLIAHKEFTSIMSLKMSPGSTYFPLVLLLLIAMGNISGLLPYVFTASSHLTFTLTMAFPIWAGLMFYSYMKSPILNLAHMVPLGTPNVLLPFMVMIELVSNLIRPITLSVRLAANMVAGHLLLTLLSSPVSSQGWSMMMIIISAIVLLTTLEMAVALIQAYVFAVLSTLYFQEVDTELLD